MITVQNLIKKYGGRTVLNLEHLEIPQGQSLGLVGNNGAGKTTTLYSALTEINSQEQNIITVEDPIEYQLPGVGQIQVNPKIDLTFAQGLRAIMRQATETALNSQSTHGC